jgi:diguanylate cyclase (GGDEF)-like protein
MLFVIAELVDDDVETARLGMAGSRLRKDPERLLHLALTDELTGLYNRRYCMELLSNLISQSRRYGQPLSFAMIDLDHFKRINDSFGHLFGDRVLREISRLIQNGIRSCDAAARFGGEEIALVLPNTTTDDAMRIVDRLRRRCKELTLTAKDTTVQVTFSAGIATHPSPGVTGIQTLFQVSDENLYCAKMSGRDQVVSGLKAECRKMY